MGNPVIIDDVRFSDEMNLINDLGGVVIGIARPDAPGAGDGSHKSETSISVDDCEHVIENVGTLDGLYRCTESLINDLLSPIPAVCAENYNTAKVSHPC